MPPSHLAPSAPPQSRRYLCPEERGEIALLLAQDIGLCKIASRLGQELRQYRERFDATPPHARAGSAIGPLRRSGVPNGQPGGRSPRNWR